MHSGEYLALTGGTLNGAEMRACGLATHYSHHAVSFSHPICILFFHVIFVILDLLYLFFKQKLPLIEEQIGKLVTDDPSVVKASLEEYSDPVYPDDMSIIQRYVFKFW